MTAQEVGVTCVENKGQTAETDNTPKQRRGPLKPDIDQARRFLYLLGQGAHQFTFQTVDDVKVGGKARKDARLTQLISGSLDQLSNRLEALQAKGAAIFVTVQPTTGGRELGDVTGIRTVHADLDGGLPAKWPLAPSIVVETSPGRFQAYWLVSDWPFDEAGKAAYRGVELRLVQDHGGDRRAIDLAHVLRVPGFYHQKDQAHPFRSQLLSDNGHIYSHEQIVTAFPPVVAARRKSRSGLDARGRALSSAADWNRLISALSYIPADDYWDWFRVGAAIKYAAGDTELAFAAWNAWSATSRKYDKGAMPYKWESFDSSEYADAPVTLGTVFHLAKEWRRRGASDARLQCDQRERFRRIAEALR